MAPRSSYSRGYRLAAFVSLVAAMAAPATAAPADVKTDKWVHDTIPANSLRRRLPGSGELINHGGPVMAGAVSLYLIFYGAWPSAQQQILIDLASNIGGSPWLSISGTVNATFATSYGGAAYDAAYSVGRSLTDAAIAGIVSTVLTAGTLPTSPNAVYFVLTAADVTASSGFCSAYCGWHADLVLAGASIKYAFVGNPTTQCLTGCSAVAGNGPNDYPGVDAMASVMAHELTETLTDPLGNAWYDVTGNENAGELYVFSPLPTHR